METEKQTNYYVFNQLQTNVPFRHPLKTAETLMFFRCASNNVINGVAIFISENFKGLCEWYFKSDIAEFEFDYARKIKLKTFINKICNLTKFSIFSSSSFKPLMTWSFVGRKTWRVWLKDLLLTQIYWLVIGC